MAMNFGQALEWIKKGGQVARDGWNSKGMWLALVGATGWCINDSVPAFDAIVRKTMANTMPWIGMKTSDGAFVPWAASQTDLLAEDWCAVQSVVLMVALKAGKKVAAMAVPMESLMAYLLADW